MMLRACLPILFVFGLASLSHAQSSAVTTAQVYNEQGKHAEAIEKARAALENPDQLKPKHLTKAYYVLADSYFSLYRQDPQRVGSEDLLFMSHDAYRKAMEAEPVAGYDYKIELIGEGIWGPLFNYTVNVNYGTGMSRFDYQKARDAHNRLVELKPDYAAVWASSAYNYLLLQDTVRSKAHYQKTLDLVTAGEEIPEADLNWASTAYYMLGNLSAMTGEADRALALCEEGRKQFPESTELLYLHLEILRAMPGRLDEALALFDEAIEADPENIQLVLVKASTLEMSGRAEEALAAYKKAVEIDADNLNGNYGMAVFHVNRAAKLSKQANEVSDEKEYDRLIGLAEQDMAIAYPILETCHRVAPGETEIVRTLVMLSISLGKEEEYSVWSNKLSALEDIYKNR